MKIALLIMLLFAQAGFAEDGASGTGLKPPSQFQVKCTLLFKKFVLPVIVPNLNWYSRLKDGMTATDINHPDYHYRIKVGDLLGRGMKGSVYDIDKMDGQSPELEKLRGKALGLVLKISHQGRLFGSFRRKFQQILIDEAHSYSALESGLSAMEQDENYPKNPDWKPGTLPFAKIVAEVNTPYGEGLVKYKLSGLSATDIAKAYKAGELSQETIASMTKSLKDWYAVSQAASNHVMITPEATKENPKPQPRLMTSLDINPENLVWVTDPETLELLGSKNGKPMFAAYELGEPALTSYNKKDTSEQDYLDIWKKFIKELE